MSLSASPSFIGSLNCFRSYNAKLVRRAVDAGRHEYRGSQRLLTETNAKMIYTIPNFQNPAERTMSLEAPQAFYELAKAHNVMILEDSPTAICTLRAKMFRI